MNRIWQIGKCWRCEADDLPVLWLGPVHSADYGHGPFFCCERCILRLEALIGQYNNRGIAVDPLLSPTWQWSGSGWTR